MARSIAAVVAGTVAGLAIFSTAFYMWMAFGADPTNDPLLSF
ncbi:hypothetical protein [Mycobacterium sp. HM-7]